MCEHGEIRSLCRKFFELGKLVGRDDLFRDERERAAQLPDNVVSFEAYRALRDVSFPFRGELDA